MIPKWIPWQATTCSDCRVNKWKEGRDCLYGPLISFIRANLGSNKRVSLIFTGSSDYGNQIKVRGLHFLGFNWNLFNTQEPREFSTIFSANLLMQIFWNIKQSMDYEFQKNKRKIKEILLQSREPSRWTINVAVKPVLLLFHHHLHNIRYQRGFLLIAIILLLLLHLHTKRLVLIYYPKSFFSITFHRQADRLKVRLCLSGCR